MVIGVLNRQRLARLERVPDLGVLGHVEAQVL